MRGKSLSPYASLVLGALVLAACATNDSLADADAGLGSGGVGGARQGAGGAPADESPPPEEGIAGAGGTMDEPAPVVCIDPKETAGCAAYCETYEAACGKPCNPVYDCIAPKGHCGESADAYLLCIAESGSFTKGADGCGVVHSCKRDANLCKQKECLTGAPKAGAGGSARIRG